MPAPTPAAAGLERLVEEDTESAVLTRSRQSKARSGSKRQLPLVWIGAGTAAAVLLAGVLVFVIFRDKGPQARTDKSEPPTQPPAVASAPATPQPTATAPTGSTSWNLKHLPNDSQWFVVIKPAAIVDSAVVKQALASFGPAAQAGLQELEKELGLAITELDQLAITVKMPQPGAVQFLMIVHTRSAVDRQKILASLGGATAATHQGVSYHRKRIEASSGSPPGLATAQAATPGSATSAADGQTQGAAQLGFPLGGLFTPGANPFGGAGSFAVAQRDSGIWFADERSVVIGTESAVQEAITQSTRSAQLDSGLVSALGQLGDVQIAVVMKTDMLKSLVPGGAMPGTSPLGGPVVANPAGGNQAGAQPLESVKMIGMAARLSEDLNLTILADCAGDVSAAAAVQLTAVQGLQQLQALLGFFRGASQQQGAPDQAGPNPAAVSPTQQAQNDALLALENMLRTAKVETVAGAVHVNLVLPGKAVVGLAGLVVEMAKQGASGTGQLPFPGRTQPFGPSSPPSGQPNPAAPK